MEMSAVAVRPCRGYALWLTLQCSARLALTYNEPSEEHWLLLAIIALWCAGELIGRLFCWSSSKISSQATAHGLALGCALAGVAFQKMLFMTLSFARPAEREFFSALGETSKLSLIFFGPLTAELVLLLIVDSLLQLLLVQQQTLTAAQGFSGGFSVLIVVDLLFLALPLLLFAFGPWSSTVKTEEVLAGQSGVEQKEVEAIRSAAAAFVVAAATVSSRADTSGASKRFELDESRSNATRPLGQCRSASSGSFPIPESWFRHAEVPGLWTDAFRDSTESSVEQLLSPLGALLLKSSREAAPCPNPSFDEALDDEAQQPDPTRQGMQQRPYDTSTFDGPGPKEPVPATPSDLTGEGRRRQHYPARNAQLLSRTKRPKEDRDKSTFPGVFVAPDGCDSFCLPSQVHVVALEPSRKAPTSITGGGLDVTCNGKKPASPPATKNQESGAPTSTGPKPTTKSPIPTAKAQMNLTREDLLKYLRETFKTNEERQQQASQVSQATKDNGGLRVRGASAPQARARASSQPPHVQESCQAMMASPMAPQPTWEEAAMSFYDTTVKETPKEEKQNYAVYPNATDVPPEEQREQGVGVAVSSKGKGLQAEAGSALRNLKSSRERGGERASKDGSFSSTVASTLHSTHQVHAGNLPCKQEWNPAVAGAPCPQAFMQPEKQQDVQSPVEPPNTYSSWGEERQGIPWSKRTRKLLIVPMDPALPVVLQNSLEGDDGDRNSAFEPCESHGHNHDQVGGLGGNEGGSPMLRSAVLDPFASPSASIRPPPSVFWGRSGAFGASGTPMVSPRLLAESSGFGTGRTVDDIDVQRQSDLPFGTERYFQLSPNVALRCLDYEEAGSKRIETWRNRGENMNMGAAHFFGTPSVTMREPRRQGSEPVKFRKDIEKLRALAMERRGRCLGTANQEARRTRNAKGVDDNGSPPRQNPLHGSTEQHFFTGSGRSDAIPGEPPALWPATEDKLLAGHEVMGGIGRPRLARQGAVGASGTPMVVLRPLERGPRTPQYPARRLPGSTQGWESPPASFPRRNRYSLGNLERDPSESEELLGERSSRNQGGGWDPLSLAAGGTPVIVAVREMLSPSARPQWERTDAPMSYSCSIPKVNSREVEREGAISNKGRSQEAHWGRRKDMQQILEGEKGHAPMAD